MTHIATNGLDQLLTAVRSLAPLIHQHADAAEHNHRLSPEVVTALIDAGLFRLYLPHTLNGAELDPMAFAQVLEAIARIDGSTGWCTWIGNVNTLFVIPLADEAVATIFGKDRRGVTGSAFFPPGKAEYRNNGYVVSGRWPYASGCQHCTWYFVLCNVFDGDQPRLTAHGTPEVRACFLPIGQVTIEETWDVSGLAGTGSHDVILNQVFVPEAYTWQFGPGMTPTSAHFQRPLYRHPAYAMGVMQIGFIGLGIAQGAVDVSIELASSKSSIGATTVLRDRPQFQVRLAEAVALIRSARAWLREALQQFSAAILADEPDQFQQRTNMLLAATHATHSAAKAVDMIYTVSGASANYRRNPLQRALRDVHAVTQHFSTAAPQYESAGRMLLGLPPLPPPLILS